MNVTNIGKIVLQKDVRIKDVFWSGYQELIYKKALPYQWNVINDRIKDIEPSHAIRNFRIAAGLEKGEFYGFVFQDTDVAKWLETLSYSLINHPDPELEKTADEVIDLIGKAQHDDGYINTYYTVKEPGKRWTNLKEAHELYTAGHFIEASVAYYQATGKNKFLDIMRRFADLIDRTFGTEAGKMRGYCGHPEIELALIRLYGVTGEKRYLNLSRYFIEERGKEPYYFDIEVKKRGDDVIWKDFWKFERSYMQTHLPVRQQMTAEGHAVRLVYLYSAVADVAGLTGDEELFDVCRKIWDNITTKRMYVTGGIGSASYGETFTFDYDLPNDSMYNETCASVGMVMLAQRMLKADPDRRYADNMELQLYNGALSGISRDGTKYFYVNPLEVWPEACEKNPTYKHVKPVRQDWYSCACCPTNITRLMASLGQYIYTVGEDEIYVHLYIGNEAKLSINGTPVSIIMETEYPREEKIVLRMKPSSSTGFKLFLRIPEWCKEYECRIDGKKSGQDVLKNGYLEINRTWSEGDVVELDLHMPVRLIASNPKLRRNGNKVVIQRGPLVYCLEEADNGPNLHDISLDAGKKLTEEYDPDLSSVVITGYGYRRDENGWKDGKLYADFDDRKIPVKLKAVPYYLWCNRTPGEMIVWINREA
jgi:uncharacterized protein